MSRRERSVSVIDGILSDQALVNAQISIESQTSGKPQKPSLALACGAMV